MSAFLRHLITMKNIEHEVGFEEKDADKTSVGQGEMNRLQ